MKILFLCICVWIITCAEIEIEKDQGVLVLTEENFEAALKLYPALLVEFYAPWCGHCKKLEPEYSAAAHKLSHNDPPLYIAKMDATVHKAIAKKYEVKGYPTLKWFSHGEPINYAGGRKTDDIVTYVTKRSGPPTTKIIHEVFDRVLREQKFSIVYFGEENTPEFSEYEKSAALDDKNTYYKTNDKDLAEKHGIKIFPSITVFRKFDEPIVQYTGVWDKANI
jgi:protein disulfide-isomerase A1